MLSQKICQDSKAGTFDKELHTPDKFTNKSLAELRALQSGHGRTKEEEDRSTFKFTKIPEAYAEKLRGKKREFKDVAADMSKRMERPQKQLRKTNLMDVKKLVWFGCQKKAQLVNKEFILDDFTKDLLHHLSLYFANDESGRYDLHKGLAFVGDVGLGKTFLMEVFRGVSQSTTIKTFRIKSTQEVFDSIAMSTDDNQLANIEQFYRGHFCFDDLGQEPKVLKLFGNEINVMEKILSERYKRYINSYCMTHITTNLDFKGLNDRYGVRIYDRMLEMFNFIQFDGKSKR